MFSLAAKTVVVTGGGRGIGRGISLAMARAGANAVLTGRTAAPLEATAADARDLGAQTLAVRSDITRAGDITRIVELSLATFGYIDCWVNNAGSADPTAAGRLIDLTEQQWDNVVDLNLKWTFFACQAAARAMTLTLPSGQARGGDGARSKRSRCGGSARPTTLGRCASIWLPTNPPGSWAR